MRRYCCALALFLVLLPARNLIAQPPPPSPPPPPGFQPRDAPQKTGTASLAGRVVSLDTGRPIRRAVVRASSPEVQEGKSVSTDAEGRWELRELPAGRYSIHVSKGGFVALSFGQHRPFEAGKQVDVADGQRVDKLDVALPRGSAVTGRVVDEFGEPVTNVRVQAMRYHSVGGQRRLVPWGSIDTTDDLGQYRLHGLAPGDYYVSAQSASFMFLGASDDRSGYAQTFYPGTLNAAEATRISLAVGQEAQNIVIALAPTRIVTVSGTATSSTGTPINGGMLMLRPTAIGDMSVRPAMVRNGTWTLSGVVPGEYQLILQHVPNAEQLPMVGPAALQTAETAVERLTISGEDITGIALVTSAGGIGKGRVRFEDGTPPAGATITVQGVDPVGDSFMPMLRSSPIQPDGSFEARGLVGRRLLRPMGLPSGWTLKSVTIDGADVTDTGVEFAAGQTVDGIDVVVTQKAPTLAGTVQDQKGAAVSNYVVVLFAADSDRWGLASRFVRTARPDQTGRFLLTGVPAASYLAVALDYLEPGEEMNPEFLERMKGSATAVRVSDGENKTITLRLMPQ